MKRIVRHLPIQAYHSYEAISHSGIVQLLKSPQHYQHYKEGTVEPTPAMEFGSAFHGFVLEPDVFAKEFTLAPKFDKRTKEGKELAAKWEEDNSGKIALTAEQIDTLAAMRVSVFSHPGVASMLNQGEAEVSLFWTDDYTGLPCRIRPDWLSPYGIADLKSCCDASKDGFSKAIANFGYDVQAAFYIDGYKAVTGKSVNFYFIPVEKSAPFSTTCYMASREMVEVGRAKYRGALQLLKWCQQNNQFPGYQPNGEVEIIDLPRWASTLDFDA
jgi:hypothetical protein